MFYDTISDIDEKELLNASEKIKENIGIKIYNKKIENNKIELKVLADGKALSPQEIANQPSEVYTDSEFYFFSCPHCKGGIEVRKNEINCHIFRHGYTFRIINGKIVLENQINPHLPKNSCENLVREGKIIGCGKPFRLFRKNGKMFVERCDYI